jgi:hypothetical protein
MIKSRESLGLQAPNFPKFFCIAGMFKFPDARQDIAHPSVTTTITPIQTFGFPNIIGLVCELGITVEDCCRFPFLPNGLFPQTPEHFVSWMGGKKLLLGHQFLHLSMTQYTKKWLKTQYFSHLRTNEFTLDGLGWVFKDEANLTPMHPITLAIFFAPVCNLHQLHTGKLVRPFC